MSLKHCVDMNGNKVFRGDFVRYYSLLRTKGEENSKIGKVWCIGNMNEKQTNMPYLKNVKGENIGAWHPKAIKKITR